MLRPISYERVSTFQQVEMGKGWVDQRFLSTAFLDKNADKFTKERIFITDEGCRHSKMPTLLLSRVRKILQDIRVKNTVKVMLIVTSLDRLSRHLGREHNTVHCCGGHRYL
jgi:DNA invertase Pin-like site-specific DNA recombinase